MDFSFTDEQEMFRKTIRKFAMEELLPRYQASDKNREFPYDQRKRILEIIGQPGERDFIMAGIAVEEIARGDFNCAFFGAAAAGPSPLLDGLRGSVREKWHKDLVTGEQLFGLGLTEPDAGSDLGALKATAVRDGDHYILNGEKNSVSYMNADLFFVFARTGEADSGAKGISAFVLPRDLPGLSFSEYEDMGCRSIPRGQLFMTDARVPAENMLWPEGTAFKEMLTFLNTNKAYIGLMCIGATAQTLDETIRYVKERRAFGHPIARFEGVAFPVAEGATLVEAMRLFCYKILWMRQSNMPHMVEGAMAKWWVPRTCVQIINECLVLHGHYGYSEEFPIAQRLRDVTGWQIGDGTPQIQKIIIAREIFGREYSPIA